MVNLVEQLGELAKRSLVTRVSAVLAGNVVFAAGFGLFLYLFSALGRADSRFRYDFGDVPRMLGLSIAIWSGLGVVGYLIRERRPESRIYGVFALTTLVAFDSWLLLHVGLFSSLTWLSIMGVSAIGFALFDKRAVWVTLGSVFAIFAAYSFCVAQGRLPYFDIFANPSERSIEVSGAWLTMHGLTTGSVALLGIWLLSVILGGWHRREQRFESASITDPLTKAFNRRRFMDLLEQLCESERQSERQFAIALFDLDHFKRINDTHGHGVGDLALQSVAGILKSTLRDNDLIARFGGEEFVALLPGCDSESAYSIIERCRKAVEGLALSTPAGVAVPVTTSVGITITDPAALSPQTLLSEADKALYEAKELGRNRTVLWRRDAE